MSYRRRGRAPVARDPSKRQARRSSDPPVRSASQHEREKRAGSHGQAPNQPHMAPLSLVGEPGGPLPLSDAHTSGGHHQDYRGRAERLTRGEQVLQRTL